MSLPERFNHEDTAQLTAMIKDTRQLDHVQKPFSADHWWFTSPAVMLGTAIILAVMSFLIWKKFWYQSKKPETEQLAVEFKQDEVKIIAQPAQMPSLLQQNFSAPPAYTPQTQNFVKPSVPVLIYT